MIGSVGSQSGGCQRVGWLAGDTSDLLVQLTTDQLPLLGARLLGLAALAATIAGLAAAVYRWYVRERSPRGPVMLIGLAAVALALNTTAAFGQVLVEGGADPLSLRAVAFNTVTFLVAGVVAPLGARAGDRLAVGTVAFVGGREVDAEVGRFVQAVGRVVAVELPSDPDEIGDVASYEPVSADRKRELSGKSLLFSRRLTVAQLEDQLRGRLIEEYGVGTVDVELTAEGTVTYLAVGRQAAGIGHTLAPGTAVVAVTADPANAAAPGDLVQVWTDGARASAQSASGAGRQSVSGVSDATLDEPPSEGFDGARSGNGETGASKDATRQLDAARQPDATPQRVATAEVRAVAGETVTLAVSAESADELAGGTYRLVTLPFDPPADREFLGLLRAADATATQVTVQAGAEAIGRAVGTLEATVAAVRPADGRVRLGAADRPLEAGDELFLVGSPEAVRRVERTVTADEGNSRS